jgi:alpha-N-acetylglucosaminidase
MVFKGLIQSDMDSKKWFFILVIIAWGTSSYALITVGASKQLIHRILPNHANQFIVEQIGTASKDTFQISSRNGKIVLAGNNGVSIASALYYYLEW